MTTDEVKKIAQVAIAESGVPKVEVRWVDSIGASRFRIQFGLHRIQSVDHQREIDVQSKSEDAIRAEIVSLVKLLPGA